MQLLYYSTFILTLKLAQSILNILLPLGDLLHPSPAQLPGEYTPAYMLHSAMGNSILNIGNGVLNIVYSIITDNVIPANMPDLSNFKFILFASECSSNTVCPQAALISCQSTLKTYIN